MKLKGKIKMSKKKWENMKKIDQKRRRNIQNTHTHTQLHTTFNKKNERH